MAKIYPKAYFGNRLVDQKAASLNITTSAILYGLSVYMVIARTVAFQQTQARVSQINTVVANLDARYIAVSSAITPDVLGTYGLREGAPAFIHRYSSTKGNIGRVAAFGHEL